MVDLDPQRQELLYTGTNWRQVEEFTGCRVQQVSRALALRNGWPWSEQSIEIFTPRGIGRLEPGDWIKRGDDGEFYTRPEAEQSPSPSLRKEGGDQ